MYYVDLPSVESEIVQEIYKQGDTYHIKTEIPGYSLPYNVQFQMNQEQKGENVR